MIYFYSGTPGSGKSYHVAREIKLKLTTGKNVISTVDINTNVISKNGKRRIADFKYIPIMEINPVILYEYAYRNHKKGKEGQTLVIIDECQILFNPREFQKKDRIDWINFFTQHRHLGYNFILISQFDRLVDRQIRSLFEYEVKHRKINNYKLMVLLPFTIFAAVTVWYGIKEKMSSSFIIYNKKLARMYDSYTMFDRLIGENVKESDGAEIVLRYRFA